MKGATSSRRTPLVTKASMIAVSLRRPPSDSSLTTSSLSRSLESTLNAETDIVGSCHGGASSEYTAAWQPQSRWQFFAVAQPVTVRRHIMWDSADGHAAESACPPGPF